MGRDKQKYIHSCPHKNCNSSFNRPYRLVQHLLVHNNIKPFTCDEGNCTKSFSSRSHLNRHLNTVHINLDKDIVYSCPTCMKSYANRQNLKRHIKIHHSLKIPFSCDVCKMEFRKKNLLSAHMYIHTGIKAFSCDICLEEFVSLFEKKRHSRFHKTHSCVKCSLTFNQWSKYQKHLKTEHVESKEYICDECGRHFKQRCHIVRHLKTHDLTKNFPCPYENCMRFYSRNSNLRQHILIKHENFRHKCNVCEAKLSTKAKLQEHLFKIHGRIQTKNIVSKTTASGRKPRKDAGTLKVCTALKLAGLRVEHVESEALPGNLVEIHIT